MRREFRLRPRGQSGFTLIEGMITLFLFLIVMVVFASLAHEYSRVTRFSSAKQQSMLAASVGLEGVARELRGAVAMVLPAATGANTTTLRFRVVNPNLPDRLNPAVEPPRIPIVNVNAAPNLLTIEYTCTGSALQRQVMDAGGTVLSTQVTAFGVSGFSVQWNSNQTSTLAVTVPEETRLRTLTQSVLMLEGI